MTDTKLNNRVAIITGATQGIGLAIAQMFSDNGAKVVITDLDNDNLVRAKATFKKPENISTFAGDLSIEKNASSLIEQTISTFGQVDILVNNAGGGVILPFLSHTPETLKQTIDRNLWTTIWCSRAVLPYMKEQQYGRIINIGADSVRNGLPDHAAYNAAKGGVHGMTTGLAREFAQDGITVNTVAPCAVRTPIYNKLEIEQPELIEKFISVIPMGRAGECNEVAAMTLYLASDDAAFVTGQVLSINGGSTML